MKYLHLSKRASDASELAGITYFSPDKAKANARKDRRCGEMTACQQRKIDKAWRAEQKFESKLNAEIAAHELLMDWQEDEAQSMAFEREKRADDLYEEHFG